MASEHEQRAKTAQRATDRATHDRQRVRWTRRDALTLLGGGMTLPFVTGVARAKQPVDDPMVETVVDFEQLPEAITVDRRGNKYVTFPFSGEIRKITPNEEVSPFASGLSSVLLGVAATPPGDLYTVSTAFGPVGSTEAYRVDRDGTVETLTSFDAAAPTFPNGVAVEGDRRLVSDSLGGGVWSVTDDSAELWVESALLDPDGGDPPVGANGVALDRNGDLYVSNSDQGRIVRVPVNPDGSAGAPETWVQDAGLEGADGIRFDTQENLYVAVNDRHAVVRVTADGDVETIASADDGDALDFPSDLAFGTSKGEQTTLYVVNFAFAPFDDTPRPGVVEMDVGVPGLPINR